MTALIGLLSCSKEFAEHRRHLCRVTWISEIRCMGFDVVFIVGSHRFHRAHDILEVPAGDEYPQLPQKTRAFCEWALEHTDYQHFFKADDDTLIHPWRFRDWYQNLDPTFEYVGNKWDKNAKPYASGGAGYLLSRNAAEIIAKHLKRKHGAEDMEVGQLLRAHKVHFRPDPRFIAFGTRQGIPLPQNDLITSHKITDELWWKSFDKMGGAQDDVGNSP